MKGQVARLLQVARQDVQSAAQLLLGSEHPGEKIGERVIRVPGFVCVKVEVLVNVERDDVILRAIYEEQT